MAAGTLPRRRLEKTQAIDSKNALTKITKPQPAAAKPKTNFTSLPAELQEKIFDNVFADKQVEVHKVFAQNNATGERKVLLNVPELAVSREWYNNAIHSFWTNANFIVPLKEKKSSLLLLPSSHREKITSITFNGIPKPKALLPILECPNLETLTIANIREKEIPLPRTTHGRITTWDLRDYFPWVEEILLHHPKLKQVKLRLRMTKIARDESWDSYDIRRHSRNVIEALQAYITIRLCMIRKSRFLDDWAAEPLLFHEDLIAPRDLTLHDLKTESNLLHSTGMIVILFSTLLKEFRILPELRGLKREVDELENRFEFSVVGGMFDTLRETRRKMMKRGW